MSYRRRYFSKAELSALRPDNVSWPAVSIGVLCVFTVFAPAGLTSGMNLYLLALVAVGWLATRQPLERPLLWAVLPFGAAIVVGLVAGVGAPRYLYLKDAWYYSNPAVVIAVGYVLWCFLQDTRRGLRAFVLAGTLIALFHLAHFGMKPSLLLQSATHIRAAAGRGYNATAVALILLLGFWGRWPERLGLHPALASICLLLCATSAVLSFSRTMALVMVLGILAMAGFFARREWLRIGALALVATLALAALHSTVDTTSTQAKRSFLGKLARSGDELRVQERMTVREINEHWRGYETARGIDTWASGNAWQVIFGRGFGAQVDLGMFQNLSGARGSAPVRAIPVFHNGYVYLIVKTGIVGVLLYLLAMGWLYLVGRRRANSESSDEERFEGRLLQACVLVILVSTWVVSGAFNKFDMLSFLLLSGFLLASLTRNRQAAPAEASSSKPPFHSRIPRLAAAP